ncbi:MAG: hypothetical protein KatS3mg111_2225 [Pirellulaceae bacterium]|nr:MAG: hypothetical protein KatS3mg111_2225 [Pirellulaceae bacterium]
MMMGLGILWAVGARASAQVDEAFFDRFIAPALKQHCWDCHSHEAGEASGGLVLDSLAGLKQGGSRGAVIDTAAPDQSLLLRAIGYQDSELQMPPDGPLPAELVERFRQWAVAGYPVSEPWKQSPQPTPGEAVSSETLAANHWAYQPPVDRVAAARRHLQQLGTVDLESQLRSGIDVLVLEKLIDNGLQFSAPASRSVLLRRLSYVLLGLPPEEVMGRIDGDSLAAMDWEALVDRMLASPRFGERWARHWMDVARYADNKGYVFQEDREYPEAYRYRDWLIDAFNQDLPFDAMVKYQLAADQVPDGQSHLAAQGFLTLGRRFLNNKFDITDDRLDVVTRGLMGMTLTCARCHDHKYDPITQADYYALAGVFFNSQEPGGEPFAHRLVDAEKMQPAFILLRGSPGARGPQVPRRFVRFLAPDAPDFPDEASGRRQLAEHIVAPDNPLTARVLANRVWMHLTGAPLVDTPSDFGLRCPPPVQLPLLDHLAIYLVENGWSIKRLVRYIVTSRTFAQASEKRPEAVAVDPENRLWWRMPRQRLDFEAFRDTLLSRSGLLDRSMGGPSVRIDSMPYAPRRTLYAYIDRQNLPSLFRTFDMAGPDTHAPQRPRTSVPQQGLYMLNSPMVLDLAAKLGQRFRTMAEQQDTVVAIEGLFQQVLGRRPEGEELVWLIQFIQSDASPDGAVAATILGVRLRAV